MKRIILSLIIAAGTFGATQPASAAISGHDTAFTPVVCVTEGCTDGSPTKPRR
ncbi:MAG TPA: hypothetical protein VGN52_08520 [Burkholderiales bacterium]|jgi:hypothetical protein